MHLIESIYKKKKIIRVVYITIALVVILFFLLPIFFFFYLFDESKVKELLSKQFNNDYYKVSIIGNIEPQFWHGISLSVAGINISSASNQDLIHLDTIKCQLSWVNLAFGNYKIKRLSIDTVKLYKDSLNKYGLSKLLVTDGNNSIYKHLQFLSIDNLYILEKNKIQNLTGINLQMKLVGTYLNITSNMYFPWNNTLFKLEGLLKLNDNDELKFETFKLVINNSELNVEAQANAGIDLNNKFFTLSRLEGKIKVLDYQGKLIVEKVNIGLTFLNIYDTFISLNKNDNTHNLNLSFKSLIINNELGVFNLSWINDFIINNINMNYQYSFKKTNLKIDTYFDKFKITNKEIISNSCNQNLYYFEKNENIIANVKSSGSCKYDISSDFLSLDLKGTIDNGLFKLIMQIKNLISNKKVYLNVNGVIDFLGLNKAISKNIKVLSSYSDDSLLPFSWASLFNMDAKLKINNLIFHKSNFTNIDSIIKLNNDSLNINLLRSNVYDGLMYGNLTLKKENDSYKIKAKEIINHLSLQKLFTDLFDVKAINGYANLNVDINIDNVKKYSELYKKLNGTILINAINGIFYGVDFNLFLDPKAMTFKNEKSTIFDRLVAGFNFKKGVSNNGFINFSSPNVIGNGNGVIDFLNDKIDYQLQVKSVLPKNTQKISSVLIPLSVSGYIFSPSINITNVKLYSQEKKSHKKNRQKRRKQ